MPKHPGSDLFKEHTPLMKNWNWKKIGKYVASASLAAGAVVASNPEPIAAVVPDPNARMGILLGLAALNTFLPAVVEKNPTPKKAK